VIDEGALICILSISYCKYLGSPTFNQSPTTLKSFDRRGFRPYGLLNDFLIKLEGKIVVIDVEVVDMNLITTFFLVEVGLMPWQQ